jgi:L-asparaginase II
LTLVAEVVRNGFVESVHHGRVVAVDGSTGRTLLAIGDVVAPIFPRSAVKPLQSLAMLRAGWSPDDDEQVALASASHSGEPAHVAVVRRILTAVGLDEAALDNTPGLPLSESAAHDLIRAGGGPDHLHHNCSGKHAAMLATCVANGWPIDGYRNPAHPVQHAVLETIEDLAGEKVAAVAVDGCGAALFALSPTGLARAFTRLVTKPPGSLERRVADAMRAHPFLVGGTGRDVTTLLTSMPGLVVKDGAEGVQAASTSDGLGIALKIDDGAGRARTPVFLAALAQVGVALPPASALPVSVVLGHGQPVGQVRAGF